MPRMPVLSRDQMDAEQQEVHDVVLASTGRVGRGPAIGYAYSPGLWRIHNASSAHLENCALTPAQVRIVSLMTARRWDAAYPWSAQSNYAIAAGVEPAVIEAINARQAPQFADAADGMVHAVAHELLETGTLGDALFEEARSTIGFPALADIIGVIGHFTTTAMMGNVAGAEWTGDAPSRIRI